MTCTPHLFKLGRGKADHGLNGRFTQKTPRMRDPVTSTSFSAIVPSPNLALV
jgi:hypothetical protein